METFLADDLQTAIQKNIHESAEALAKERTATIRKWIAWAVKLQNQEDELKAAMTVNRRQVLQSKRLCLFEKVLAEISHPDDKLVQDMNNGFDLVGRVPASNTFEKKFRPANITEEALRSGALRAREAMLRTIKASGDAELDCGVYEATLTERDAGHLEGPLAPTSLPTTAILTMRFGLRQGHKLRPIDNYKTSLVNYAVTQSETITVHTLDVCAAMVATWLRQTKQAGVCGELVAKTWDLSGAYKQLALSDTAYQQDSYLAIFNPYNKTPEIFKQKVLPFGAKASVTAFVRCSYGIWTIGARALALMWTSYFDDFLSVCPPEVARHTEMIIQMVFSLLGWKLSEDKLLPYDSVCSILGAKLDLKNSKFGAVSLANTSKRTAELVETLDSILTEKRLSRSEGEKLRGRLQFAACQIFSRRLRHSLRDLNQHVLGGGGVVSERTAESLYNIKYIVANSPPRCIDANVMEVLHVYVDASFTSGGHSGIGGMLVDVHESTISWFGETCSAQLLSTLLGTEGVTCIFELEALAVLTALLQWEKSIAGRHLVVFTDNEGVHGAFVKCYSDNQKAHDIIRTVCEIEDRLGILIWYERVPSPSNPSDPLSGNEFVGFNEKDRCHPKLEQVLDVALDHKGPGVGQDAA